MAISPVAPIVPTLPEDTPLWLLKQRYGELGTTFRAAWDNYLKFFTVFLTFSVAALGWWLAHLKTDPLPRSLAHLLASVFIAQSALTAMTSIAMALYSSGIQKNYVLLEKGILGGLAAPDELRIVKPIPVLLAIWAGGANAIAMIGMVAVWAYLGFYLI